jgi:hypothetical protein
MGMWHCSLHIYSMHIYASCTVDKYIFIRYKSRITSNLPNAATCDSLFSKFLTIVHIYITQYILSFLRVIFKGILNDSWLCGPGSVVGITTGYRLDGSGIESCWGARFSAPVQTGPGAHPASCTMGTRFFPGVKSGWGVTLTPHPLLVPWSKKG